MNQATAIVALCAIAPIPVFGLGADDATRPSPPSEARPSSQAVHDDSSTAGAVKAGEDQILLPSLRGLAIAAAPETALKLQRTMKRGIRLDGFSESESAAILKIVSPVMGQPVTVRSLERLSSTLELAFRSLGRPFMQVSFPPQEITSGVIAVRICPARAGQLLLAGNPSFGMKFAAHAFRTLPGQEISGDGIVEDLEWLNENPLRRASISYCDGATPEMLDLTLRLNAPKPWRAYAGIDNPLSDDLGDERIFLGFQYGDLFSLDHRLTAQYTAALELKNLQGISAIYEIPLPWRHLFQIAAGYTESDSNSTGPIDQSGQFSNLNLKYRIPLPRWHSISQETRFGFDIRNNDYLFSDGSSNHVRFAQIESGWKGRLSDRFGMSRLDVSLLYSPGLGLLGSNDEDFIALGASGAESLIARMEIERTLKLGEAGVLVGRGQAQWSDSPLLSSDQISAGGVNQVRGFDETVGYASKGIIGTLEMQSPGFLTPHCGEFKGITFIDGAFWDGDEFTQSGQVASVGVGLRWQLEEALSARLDLGIPFDYSDDVDGKPRLHFAISKTW